MKIVLTSLLSCGVGIALGAAAAVYSFGDPGPDFASLDTQRPAQPQYSARQPDRVRPSIDVLGGEEFDFGVMDRGETRSHTFHMRNNTDQLLQLEVVSTTCKCAVGELERDAVPPGQEGSVTLEWTAKSLDTEFRQSATIGTNYPARPNIILSVFGRVLQTVRAVPPDVAFSDVTIRESRTAEFVLYGFKEEELRILKHDWVQKETAEFFEFDWKPAPAEVIAAEPDAQSAVLCTVRMASGQPMGPVRQTLALTTSATGGGVIDFPIQGRIVGDVSISGSGFQELVNTLRLGPVPRSRGIKRKLLMTVKGPYREEFEITEVKVHPDDVLQVRVEPPRSLRQGLIKLYPISIEVPAGARPVNFSGGEEHSLGEITLSTNHPEIGTMQLKVRFAVTE